MLFNSLSFLLLLPLTILAYYGMEKLNLKDKVLYQNLLLILFSCGFYFPYAEDTLMGFFIIVFWNYLIGLLSIAWRPALLVGILGDVFFFFYYKILSNIVSFFCGTADTSLFQMIIPVGFSFILFQCLSYLLDIKQGKVSANRNVIQYLLYILFFPKILQGPIVQYSHILPDLQERKVDFSCLIGGLERFILGLSKKVLLADALASEASRIFAQSEVGIDVPTAWLGSFLFTLQIYLDFSSYSDMAIGLARVFGFHFPENFDFPYSSLSVSEFWRRWHISLGAWFREYIYIPMGGSKKGNVYLNLFTVFLVTGLWHGTTWIFILWGVSHGICVVIEKYLRSKGLYERIPVVLRWIYTFMVVNVGWLAFKLPDMTSFKRYVNLMLGQEDCDTAFSFVYWCDAKLCFLMGVCVLGMILLKDCRIVGYVRKMRESSLSFNVVYYMVLTLLFSLSLIGIVSNTYNPFLYFQF